MEDKCPCGNERDMTDDHIVPKWITRNIQWLELGWSKKTDKEHAPIMYVHEKRFKRRLCHSCNAKKGGRIDWLDPVVRGFMWMLADKILKKLDETKT